MRAININYKMSCAFKAGRHLIASVKGCKPGPTLIVLGSVHGNEPAGAMAAQRVMGELEAKRAELCGEVILLAGNTRALVRGVRYVDTDLNRHWSPENIRSVRRSQPVPPELSESIELRELLGELEGAMKQSTGELYFVDLHTTSAQGVPFATVGDTLRNRAFAQNFPVTIVLGLEEQIEGTALEYVNNLGAVTMGLEAGQHDAPSSTDHHEAVIWLAMVAAGNLRRTDVLEIDDYYALLERASGGARIVEIRHRHPITPADEFKMEPGYENFQPVRRGQTLAHDRHGPVRALENGVVVLPLYQSLGDDGFFLGREVKPFWLKLSAILRRLRIQDYVYLLPGVWRDEADEESLIVNTRIARILPLQIFHLLGFRKRRWKKDRLVVSRRKFDLAGPVGKSQSV